MNRLLFMASLLSCTTIFAGCFGTFDDEHSDVVSLELTSSDLVERSVYFTSKKGDWATYRIQLKDELWGDQQCGNPEQDSGYVQTEFIMKLNATDTEEPYFMFSKYFHDGSSPILAFESVESRTYEVSFQVAADCEGGSTSDPLPTVDLVWLIGAESGRVSLQIGIDDGGGTESNNLKSIFANRSVDRVVPNAEGMTGFAGTVIRMVGGEFDYLQTLGTIRFHESEALGTTDNSVSVNRNTIINGSKSVTGPGTYSIFLGHKDRHGFEFWRFNKSTPAKSESYSGISIIDGPSTEQAWSVPYYTQGVVNDSGMLKFELIRKFHGIPTVLDGFPSYVIGTWGYVDLDLFDFFNWPFSSSTNVFQKDRPLNMINTPPEDILPLQV